MRLVIHVIARRFFLGSHLLGNPPTKRRPSRVEFSRNKKRRFCNEETTIYQQPDHGGVEAGRGGHVGAGFMP